jgi:pSer/pThr/pTyr-binding forkhead associated (FHA) protein
MQVEYYLVSAARRSYRLRPGRTYVFGRETTVDIPLQDALASRRHAELRWKQVDDKEGWEIVDLNSRNGVLVNGERTKESTLTDSDQIQIGGQVFRYHLLPPGADPASIGNQAPQISNVETMGPGVSLMELASQGAAFTGVLSDGLLVMLQFLQGTSKTGRLDCIGGTSLGSVFVEKGTPVHATYEKEKGIDALIALAVSPPPRFAFHGESLPDERTITGSANGVMMEVARQMDEIKRSGA